MNPILQMRKVLQHQPLALEAAAGTRVRTFSGRADAEAWLRLRDRAFAREQVGVRQWDVDDFQREFEQQPWWRPDRFWLAEICRDLPDQGESWEIVGSVALARRGDVVAVGGSKPVVHWLMVDPRWRRRGMARRLMAELEAAVWRDGEREIFLETHRAWRKATAFYQTLGYETVD